MRHPVDTEAVNAHGCWKPWWRRVGTVTQQGRLNPAGLSQAECEPTGHVSMRPLTGTVNEKGQADRHIHLHRVCMADAAGHLQYMKVPLVRTYAR